MDRCGCSVGRLVWLGIVDGGDDGGCYDGATLFKHGSPFRNVSGIQRSPVRELVFLFSSWLVGNVVGFLVGWLVDFLVGNLVGFLVDWLTSWLVGLLFGWFLG